MISLRKGVRRTIRKMRDINWMRLQRNRPSDPIITRLANGMKVRVYPMDVIGRPIYVSGLFEEDECHFVMGFLKPGMTVFDIGANLGQYTLLAAGCIGLTGSVHSFEPSKRIFTELVFNTKLNGLEGICCLNNVAVAEREGVARLSLYEPGKEVYGSLGEGEASQWGARVVGHELVRTITLDNYVAEHSIAKVDLLKIDIEGAELLALRGAQALLSGKNAPVLIVEMADINTEGFGYRAVETWDYLAKMGYRFYGIPRQGESLREFQYPGDSDINSNLVAMKEYC